MVLMTYAGRPSATDPFVPNGESRQDTAILLVGTAEEFGIDQRSIRVTPSGFYITEELADVLYDESTEEPADEQDPNTSGNRAAKTNTTEQE